MHHTRQPFPLTAVGQHDLPMLVLAALIAGTDRDALDIDQADVDRLFELYPKGWGLVIAGHPGGALKVTLVGEQGRAMLGDLLDRAAEGGCLADEIHPSFIPRRGPEERR